MKLEKRPSTSAQYLALSAAIALVAPTSQAAISVSFFGVANPTPAVDGTNNVVTVNVDGTGVASGGAPQAPQSTGGSIGTLTNWTAVSGSVTDPSLFNTTFTITVLPWSDVDVSTGNGVTPATFVQSNANGLGVGGFLTNLAANNNEGYTFEIGNTTPTDLRLIDFSGNVQNSDGDPVFTNNAGSSVTYSQTANFDNVALSNPGVAISGATTRIGSFTNLDNTNGFRIRGITLDAVPEPSAILLSALGLIGLARRRR